MRYKYESDWFRGILCLIGLLALFLGVIDESWHKIIGGFLLLFVSGGPIEIIRYDGKEKE